MQLLTQHHNRDAQIKRISAFVSVQKLSGDTSTPVGLEAW
jgi:hypothetical protein